MFLINNQPCSEVIRSVMNENPELTSSEVYQFIMNNFSEPWFTTTTPSLKGNDNRLFHRVRSLFSK